MSVKLPAALSKVVAVIAVARHTLVYIYIYIYNYRGVELPHIGRPLVATINPSFSLALTKSYVYIVYSLPSFLSSLNTVLPRLPILTTLIIYTILSFYYFLIFLTLISPFIPKRIHRCWLAHILLLQ